MNRDEIRKDVRNDCGADAPAKLMGAEAACRQSAESLLREHIHRLRREADGLDALLSQLPRQLSNEADAALWDLIIKIRR